MFWVSGPTSTVLSGHPGLKSAREALLFKKSLLNVQSLIITSFILHYFFISRNLDFIFTTETGTKYGDLNAFS